MKLSPSRLWVVSILLGWMFDFLFWKQQVGLNFALFLALCLLGGLGLLLFDGLRPARSSLLLLIPFLFFGVVTFLVQETLTLTLAYAFSLLSLGLFVNSYLGGRWYQYGLQDYFSKFFGMIGEMFIPPFQSIQRLSSGGGSRFPVLAILRGLLIAFPIVAFFAFLLASADAIFAQKMDALIDAGNIGESLMHLLIILFVAWILAGILLHTATQSRDAALSGDNPTVRKRPLGLTEAAIVLGSVAFLFLFFVIIQFQYFFGGETNIGVQGYTYSQYARRGFSELITVAFFSLVLILGLYAITRRADEVQRRIHIILDAVIVSEVMVMLFSAYQRLMLAIDWHGFSRLRLYPRIFMVWLGILLVAIVILEILRCERFFALAFLLASLGFAVSLSMVNVDVTTITHNLERVKYGKTLNVGHLASISTDAIPALAEAFRDPTFTVEQHEGIGATLVCYLNSGIMESNDDWRSFNLSRWRAKKILAEVAPLLSEYHFNDKKYPVRARTPSGEYHLCVDE